jgi:hypothetical protein
MLREDVLLGVPFGLRFGVLGGPLDLKLLMLALPLRTGVLVLVLPLGAGAIVVGRERALDLLVRRQGLVAFAG